MSIIQTTEIQNILTGKQFFCSLWSSENIICSWQPCEYLSCTNITYFVTYHQEHICQVWFNLAQNYERKSKYENVD